MAVSVGVYVRVSQYDLRSSMRNSPPPGRGSKGGGLFFARVSVGADLAGLVAAFEVGVEAAAVAELHAMASAAAPAFAGFPCAAAAGVEAAEPAAAAVGFERPDGAQQGVPAGGAQERQDEPSVADRWLGSGSGMQGHDGPLRAVFRVVGGGCRYPLPAGVCAGGAGSGWGSGAATGSGGGATVRRARGVSGGGRR